MAGLHRGFEGFAAAIAAALLASAPAGAQRASADNAGKPMTFEWGAVYGDVPAIFADGDFTVDTPDALRAFHRSMMETKSLGFDTLKAAQWEQGRAVRAMLAKLEAKGHIRHREEGLKYVYAPVTSRSAARRSALQQLVRAPRSRSEAGRRPGRKTPERSRRLPAENPWQR